MNNSKLISVFLFLFLLADGMAQVTSFPIDVDTIPLGKRLLVYYVVEVNDNIPNSVDSIEEQINFSFSGNNLLSTDPRDIDLFDPTTTPVALLCMLENITLVAGSDQSVCINTTLDLSDVGAMIASDNLVDAFWSTSGDGSFSDPSFFTSTTYFPGEADRSNGRVQIQLTLVDSVCGTIVDDFSLTIQRVDCGNFPWNGNDE